MKKLILSLAIFFALTCTAFAVPPYYVDVNGNIVAKSITTGSVVSIEKYASIAAAVTAIGSTATTLVVDTAQTVSASVVIPSTLALKVVKPGLITINTGVTLTINGPFEAGLYQVFNCVGTGAVGFGLGAVKEVYPEWWGVTGTADNVAIQAALTAVQGIAPVRFLAKTYQITAKLAVPDGGILSGVASAWETTAGTVFNCVGAITCIETINGGGPYYIEGITLTGGAATAVGIHVAAHSTRLKNINIIDFTGDYGIKVDNVGVSVGGPDTSSAENIFVMANSAGFPITTHPLKHAISFGVGTLGFKLDTFKFWYTGVDTYGILDFNGAKNVFVNNGDIVGGWISDATDVRATKIIESNNISFKNVRYEKNNHGVWATGTSLGNYNLSFDNVTIDGSYPGSGTSHWSKTGFIIDVYNNTVVLRNCVVGNVYGTGTDIQLSGPPTNFHMYGTLTDDAIPNDGDSVSFAATAILSGGASVTQADIVINSAIPTFPWRAKAIWGLVHVFTAGTVVSIYPQSTATGTMGIINAQCPTGDSSFWTPFYLPLNGNSMKISYFVTGGTVDIIVAGWGY